jgi:predicted pyridoxine 5'-phosphate oxidase superfamily flavin-nucleotide-binding protein
VNDLADIAKTVIDANTYLVLGTADATGAPWVTPVYFTARDYRDFYWVSSPDAQHSRNLSERPEISIAIFDSHSVVGKAEAVYIHASAIQVPDDSLAEAAAIYNSNPAYAGTFEVTDLRPPALFRLYHARALEHSVLIRGGDPKYGRGADSRMTVTL